MRWDRSRKKKKRAALFLKAAFLPPMKDEKKKNQDFRPRRAHGKGKRKRNFRVPVNWAEE